MSYSSPAGGVSNRVSLSGKKHPRSDSIDSINDSTKATTKSSADIINDYTELLYDYAERLVCKYEKEYFAKLTECNKDLEEQRVFLNPALQKALGSTTTELEPLVLTTFDKAQHDANEELEREVAELSYRLEALQFQSQEDSNNERIQLATKELNEKTRINELLTKDLATMTKELDVRKKVLDTLTKDLNESKKEKIALAKKIRERTDKANLMLSAQSSRINKLTEELNVSMEEVAVSTKKHDTLTMELEEMTVKLNVSKKELNVSRNEVNEKTKFIDSLTKELEEMTMKLDVSKKELDEKTKINDSLTLELDKKTQINETLTKELEEMTKKLDEQNDEAQFLLSEERKFRTKCEATINHLTEKCNSLTLDLNVANEDKKVISDVLSRYNQDRISYFEELKEDRHTLQIEYDKLREEMSKRSVVNSSLESQLIDSRRENQQLENHIDEITGMNEKLASEYATLEIEKSCLEGQVSAAREETIEIQQRAIATDTEYQELRQQVSHLQHVNRANAELTTVNQSLRQQVSQLQAANTSTTDEIPFTRSFNWVTEADFSETLRPQLNVLKQEIVSSADWLAGMGMRVPPIVTEHLDKILLAHKASDTLVGRIYSSQMGLLNEALKYAKKHRKYDPRSLPSKIDEAFCRKVVGCTKDELADKLVATTLMSRDICTILFGKRSTTHSLEADHIKARDLRLALELSNTIDEFFRLFHWSNTRFTFQDTNNLKGNVPVVEARQVIDSHGNFQGWEFRQRGQPGPEDMLTRVNNNEIGLYTNLVEDGNLATVVLNVAVGGQPFVLGIS
jgi:hypothetical protein